jgi:kanamycin kinase
VRALAGPPPAGTPLPAIVSRLAGPDDIEPVWLNLEGGLTVRLGERYLKWVPFGLSLREERERLEWASTFHPVPQVIDHGGDEASGYEVGGDEAGEWMLTRAIDAVSAVTMASDPRAAAVALGEGLRALHDNLPVQGCPFSWSAELRGGIDAPPVEKLVVAHGDACLPNTLVDGRGRWAAHVDLGRLGLADRWADLAVASISLDWNLGAGWQSEFFAAYGVQRDEERIAYYRALWDHSA